MLGEELSRALSDISDDKIEAAANMVPKSRKHTWMRVAVCAAVVALVIGMTVALWPQGERPGEQMGMPTLGTTVAPTELPTTLPDVPTAPTETKGYELVKLTNVVKLYACDKENASEEELKEYEITDAVDGYKVHWIEELDSYRGIRFALRLPDDYHEKAEIIFKLETSLGEYLIKDKESGKRVSVGKTTEIGIGEIVAWRPEDDLQSMKDNIDPGEIYLHITIYADDHIVGFGVIEMASNYILDRSFYAVTLRRFRAVSFPMVDGEYQDVTEEYIREQIAECEQIMREECNALREEMAKEPEGV